jgi:dTDP-4-dehydrorhamnose reductase
MQHPFGIARVVALSANSAVQILVLGATGLLGNAVFRGLSRMRDARVDGTVRRENDRSLFTPEHAARLTRVEDIENSDEVARLFEAVGPDVVVNCVAVGRPAPADPIRSISVYSVLPRRLSHLCRRCGIRFIQISSDGVFSGTRGSYTEDDLPDANDVYGISKMLGEIAEPHAITLRTSIIGHELQPGSGLLEWFLSQQDRCGAYTRAIFSGFPTIVLADLIRDVVIPRPDLHGVYHVATRPISKFDLLQLVAKRYGKAIELIPDDRASPDRSLVAARFEKATGYVAPDWPTLVDLMYCDRFGTART